MKYLKLFLLCLCCVGLTFSCVGFSLAFSEEPNLCYDGNSKEFVFLNTNGTDLFRDFKGVMPGDTVEQHIVVRGENIKNVANLYLRAVPKNSFSVPENISLKVYQGSKLISDASLSDSGNLEENVLIYSFTESGKTDLTVVLDVPTSVGNEIAGVQSDLEWFFTIQENDASYSLENPKTGDNSNLTLYFVLAVVSLLGILILFVTRKDKKQNVYHEK